MFIRMTLGNNIKSTNPKTDSAKDMPKYVEDSPHFDSTNKSLAGSLMDTLTIMKFEGSRTILL